MKNKPPLKMNVRALRQIQRDIAREPRRLNMMTPVDTHDDIAPCGTTACIAGFAVINDLQKRLRLDWKAAGKKARKVWGKDVWGERDLWRGVEKRAIKILGITENQAYDLFYSHHWPDRFADKYEGLLSDGKRVQAGKVAIRRIEAFIKSKGEI